MNDAMLRKSADQDEITRVLIRYCVALDRMELDELASLFTLDCDVSYGEAPQLHSRGRQALRQSLERMWRWSRTSHHLSNVLIDVAADAASALSYVLAWHERPDGTTATVFGKYHDQLVRVDGLWLIDVRRMVMNGADAGFKVPLHAAGRRPAPGVSPFACNRS